MNKTLPVLEIKEEDRPVEWLITSLYKGVAEVISIHESRIIYYFKLAVDGLTCYDGIMVRKNSGGLVKFHEVKVVDSNKKFYPSKKILKKLVEEYEFFQRSF